MGKAVRADLATAWRDRGPRWSAAAGPVQRACPGDGGYRRNRHRLVGHQGESSRFAGLPVIRSENRPIFTYATGGYYRPSATNADYRREQARFLELGYRAVKLTTVPAPSLQRLTGST